MTVGVSEVRKRRKGGIKEGEGVNSIVFYKRREKKTSLNTLIFIFNSLNYIITYRFRDVAVGVVALVVVEVTSFFSGILQLLKIR